MNPFNQYGAGAESKMRLYEANVINNNSSNAGYRAVPIAEGRMRVQTQPRYSSSLEANISRGVAPSARLQQPADRSSKFPAASSTSSSSGKVITTTAKTAPEAVAHITSKTISVSIPSSTTVTVSKKIASSSSYSATKPKNPFEEDDVNDENYDESKNPFADEPDGDNGAVEAVADIKGKVNPNPFDEYDNNLNPFA